MPDVLAPGIEAQAPSMACRGGASRGCRRGLGGVLLVLRLHRLGGRGRRVLPAVQPPPLGDGRHVHRGLVRNRGWI